MLRYTSCLFATVALHAWILDVPSYQYMFQLVTVLSILNYSTYNAFIQTIDTVVAHAAFCLVMLDVPAVYDMDLAWLLLFPTAVGALWIAESFFYAELLHCLLHVVAVVGANFFLHFLYS